VGVPAALEEGSGDGSMVSQTLGLQVRKETGKGAGRRTWLGGGEEDEWGRSSAQEQGETRSGLLNLQLHSSLPGTVVPNQFTVLPHLPPALPPFSPGPSCAPPHATP